MANTGTFERVLEEVESLPLEQQEDLLGLVHRRLVDSRREALAGIIKEARTDYHAGKGKRGSVDDLLKDLRE